MPGSFRISSEPLARTCAPKWSILRLAAVQLRAAHDVGNGQLELRAVLGADDERKGKRRDEENRLLHGHSVRQVEATGWRTHGESGGRVSLSLPWEEPPWASNVSGVTYRI